MGKTEYMRRASASLPGKRPTVGFLVRIGNAAAPKAA